jgi:hypothetical protein
MDGGAVAKLDLRHLLAAAEAAPPVDAIDVVGQELGRMVGATRVGLLIANFSGDAVVRMSHVTVSDELRDGRNERTESIPLAGSVYEKVMLSQELDVCPAGTAWDVLVPVTERGDTRGQRR